MVGSLHYGGTHSPSYVSSTEKWQEFLNFASGNINRVVNSITENASSYMGGGSVSVSDVLGRMTESVADYADTVRECASKEAQPNVSRMLKDLRSKVREKIPFEVRSYIPETVRDTVDKIIKMGEKSRLERHQEEMRNASVVRVRNAPAAARSTHTISSSEDPAVHHAVPMNFGCCDDYVLCQNLVGGFEDDEESQDTSVSCPAPENASSALPMNEPHCDNSGTVDRLVGVYSYYYEKGLDNKKGQTGVGNTADFARVYNHYYQKDIAQEEVERKDCVSSTAPSAQVEDVQLTAPSTPSKSLWQKIRRR